HTLDLGPAVPFWAKILGTERTGHVANPCPIGPVAFWTPFYLLARALEWVAGLFVRLPAEQQPGQTVFDFWMAGLGSLLAGRRRQWNESARAISGGLILSACAFAVFLPQLLIWHYYFGTLRTPQPPGHMRWSDPGLVATLFSTRAGLFPWTPIYYLVIPGLIL